MERSRRGSLLDPGGQQTSLRAAAAPGRGRRRPEFADRHPHAVTPPAHEAPAEFEVVVQNSDHGTCRVMLAGELDLFRRLELAEALAGVLERKPEHVVLDLHRVTFIDASTIGLFATLYRDLAPARDDRRVTVIASQPIVLRLLELTGLDRVLHVVREAEPDAG
jgi:anti-anti-sigma factor